MYAMKGVILVKETYCFMYNLKWPFDKEEKKVYKLSFWQICQKPSIKTLDVKHLKIIWPNSVIFEVVGPEDGVTPSWKSLHHCLRRQGRGAAQGPGQLSITTFLFSVASLHICLLKDFDVSRLHTLSFFNLDFFLLFSLFVQGLFIHL